jgi:hypothetical protein
MKAVYGYARDEQNINWINRISTGAAVHRLERFQDNPRNRSLMVL